MKTRIVLIALSVVLGLGAAFSVVTYLNSVRVNVDDSIEPVEVLAAEVKLPRGLSLEELRDRNMIKIKSIPRDFVPESAVHPDADLEGLVLSVSLNEGETLTSTKFAAPKEAGLAFTTPEGLVAMAINANDASAVGNHIRVGDFVNIIMAVPLDFEGMDGEDLIALTTGTLLESVQVLAIRDNLEGPESGEVTDPGALSEDNSSSNKTVTIAVTQEEAVLVVQQTEWGFAPYLTLVRSSDAPDLTSGDDFVKEETEEG